MTCRISPPAAFKSVELIFFAYRTVVLGLFQGQTRNTRILERKPLINTSYCMQHRLELKYLLEQPLERLPDDWQWLKLGLKLELCRLTNEL